MNKTGVIGILLVVGVLYGVYQSDNEEAPREEAQRNSTQYAQPDSIYSVPDYSGNYTPYSGSYVPDYSGIGYNSYSNDSYSAPVPSICSVCRGGLGCKVCGGTGTYSFLGNSSDCSACGGTGNCWNCGGSGYA